MAIDVRDWIVGDGDQHYRELHPAAVEPLRALDDADYALGARLYAMVWQWNGWVHRRVERVSFDDTVSSQRHVSIDCTLRGDLAVSSHHEDVQDERDDRTASTVQTGEQASLVPAPAGSGNTSVSSRVTATRPDRHLYYIPLSMHRKHRVTRLSVRDEGGSPVPVLTQARCAYLGTTTLAVGAVTLFAKLNEVEELPDAFVVPPDVLADLDFIATQHWRLAVARWAVFPWIPSEERTRAEVRRREPGGNPMTASGPGQSLVPVTSEALLASRLWRQLLTDPSHPASEDYVSLANDFARNYLMVAEVWDDGRRHRVLKVSFEEQRRVPPPYVLSTIRRAFAQLRARGRPSRSFPPAGPARPGGSIVRTLWRKSLRALAIKPKIYRIPVPALGRCECYHLEVEAPDGLQVTGARLRAVVPSDPSSLDKAPQIDSVDRSVQRVHLHLAGVPQGQIGEAVVAIRPRAWNVLLAATTASLLTVVLLAIIGVAWDEIHDAKTNASALLLALPGGLGFFVARRTESGLVTASLRGVRVLAFLTGMWALGGAAVVVADPECGGDRGSWLIANHTGLACAPDYLWVLMLLAFINLVILSAATWFALVPPLRREIDEQDMEDFDEGRSETAFTTADE